MITSLQETDPIVIPNEPSPQQPGMRIVELDFHRDSRWEAFVDQQPSALIFHHPAWLEVLERESGQPCLGLACERDDGTLEGVLPLVRTRGLPFGLGGSSGSRRLSSLPRTPIAGPLARSQEATAALISAACQQVEDSGGRTLQIKSAEAGLDQLVGQISAVPWRTSYAVVLPEQRRRLTADECFKQFGPCDTCRVLRFGNCDNHRHVTWAVKKARNQQVQVAESESVDDLDEWYGAYLETMRRNIVPARSRRLFHAMWELLRPRGYMRLLIARHQPDGRMIGGTIVLTYKSTAFAAFAASYQSDFGLHPNDILHWVGIHDACRQGSEVYDFGEVPSDAPNLARFKRKWNCAETQLARYCYPAITQQDSEQSGSSAVKTAVARVWVRLPLKATAVLGDWIYRYL